MQDNLEKINKERKKKKKDIDIFIIYIKLKKNRYCCFLNDIKY